MEILSMIYLGYMFVSFYFLSLFLFLYLNNRKNLFDCPKIRKKYGVSIVIPCWNEEKTIGAAIEHLLGIKYKGLRKIIIVDDCSSDNSYKIIKEYAKKYPKKIMALKTPKQTGSAAGAKDYGAKFVKTELIAFVDADSYPAKDSLTKIVGFFDDEKVGAATCVIVPRNRSKLIEKMQVIEYNVIAFTRKLLGYVDAIYVTPGPLAVYRKSVFDKVGGFDIKNMTEDIEIVWHLIKEGYKVKMNLTTTVTTTVPNSLKMWYRQRRRWNIGGLQCISKYKKEFLKKGMLGTFVLPFFILQLFLGVLGLGVFLYLTVTRILSDYLFVKYSIPVGVPLLTIEDLYITPSFLNYFGAILFFVGLIFTFLVFSVMKRTILKKQNIFNILFYSIIYLMIYPIIMISAIYNYFKRDTKWR